MWFIQLLATINMNTFIQILFLSFTCLISCSSPSETSIPHNKKNEIPISKKDSLKPILGHRFEIYGDFNGDGISDTLTEHYFDGNKKVETNKFYENIEYDSLVSITIKKNPISFVTSTDQKIDTLKIYSGGHGQLLGLSYLKNEGDLNNDGTDEVSYVIDWADWSNLNTWHLMTFKNKKWTELYSFKIWDWLIPENLNEFKGLIKPINKNEIQVIYMNEEAIQDTIIINLKTTKNSSQHRL